MRPLNVVGKRAVRMPNQTHTVRPAQTRPENTPESDTCLKVKFNLIKISAQAKTLRGSVYILLLQETRVEMIYGTHAERGKHTQEEQERRRAGQEVGHAEMNWHWWRL